MAFRYAHLADLHLGSWREPKMRAVSTQVFLNAIDRCIEENVDFVLFAGDLFNTSMPAVDTLKIVTKKLKELNKRDIPLYAIAGSHDFSPSGKTMLDVLENAGLLINVCKGSVNPETKQLELKITKDEKTGAKITGIIGRRGMLDKSYYENLNRISLEQEEGYKIFMFHTTLTELKPKHLEMLDSQPSSFLPKHFNYYAGGHIHHRNLIEITEYGTLTYTGALFPNNFAELEKYSHGGFYIIDVNDSFDHKINFIDIKIKEHKKCIIDANEKLPEQVKSEILNYFNEDLNNSLITIRIKGKLAKGKTSDINFQEIFKEFYEKGAYFVMKNTTKLSSKEFEQIMVNVEGTSPEQVEEDIIKEHLQQLNLFSKGVELNLSKELLKALNTKKIEGEKSYDFQTRIKQELNILLENQNKNSNNQTNNHSSNS